MHLLLVEDESMDMRIINSAVKDIALIQQTDEAHSYKEAVQLLDNKSYSVVLADIKLNDQKDGIDLCRQIRVQSPQTIVILITGYDTTERLKASYESGCFDYVRKPFSRIELGLKVRRWIELMLCRPTEKTKLAYRGLEFDFSQNQFRFNNQPLRLSKSCKQLLLILLKNAESLVSREEIQRELWGDHDTSLRRRNIGERIQSLRRQLPAEVADWIVSVAGEGYVLGSP